MAIDNVSVTQNVTNVEVAQVPATNLTVTQSGPINIDVATPGPQGAPGPANVLTPGTVTSLAPAATAPTVTITGTSPNQTINFGIPAGAKIIQGTVAPASGTGLQGDWYQNTSTWDHYEKTSATVWTLRGNIKGATGNTGPAPTLNTPTVTALAVGATPTVSMTGTNPYTINFGIPASAVWWNGTAPPATGTGAVGDYYLVSSGTGVGDVYKKTAAATWTLQGNIRGAAGTGNVSSSGTIVAGNLSSFTDTTGGLIQDSGVAANNIVLLTGSQNIGGAKTFTTGFTVNTGVGYTSSLDSAALSFTRASANYIQANTVGGYIRLLTTNTTAGDTITAEFRTTGTALDATNGNPLTLKPGSADAVYMAFNARTATPSTRSGYIGYDSGGTLNLSMKNEISGGAISIYTTGNGAIGLNAGTGTITLTSGIVNATTQLQEAGQRVYSPNNKPTKTDVGLSLVDNIADVNKPMSTPQKNYVQSRQTNLITNGSGLLGDNTNFSGFTFVSSDSPSGGGSFKYGPGVASKQNDELIPVNPTRTYNMSHAARETVATATTNYMYSGISEADIDNLVVGPTNSLYLANTTTTLAAPLNPGDTTVTLTSGANWHTGATTSLKYVQVWNYTDGKGKTWPANTYTRNVAAFASISGNVVTLSAAWSGPAAPAGTAVSNGQSAGTYKYLTATNVTVPQTWTTYSGTISGVITDGQSNNNKFYAGTAYVKLLWLLNYTGSDASSVHAIGNVEFYPVDDYLLNANATIAGLKSFSGGSLSLTNATSNMVKFGSAGIAAPAQSSSRSAGTKVLLYDSGVGTRADFAIGIESGAMWHSVDQTTNNFKWYGGTTLAATLTGAGNLSTTGTITSNGVMYAPARLRAGFNAATTSATSLTTSAAEFELSSQSLITIGENVAGQAHPAITWYRTASGTRSGTAFRQFLDGSNGPFRFQKGPNNTAYGSETYTDLVTIDLLGTVTASSFAGSGASLTGITATQVGLGNVTNAAQVDLASTQTVTGAKTFSNTVTITAAGGLNMNAGSTNLINFNQVGVAAPAFTTRSAGTKIVLYNGISGTATDFALGVESGAMWNSVSTNTSSFKWYAGTTNIATLSGAGNLTTAGSVTATSFSGSGASLTGLTVGQVSGAAPLASPTFTGTVSGITATMVGLGNVPNVDMTNLSNAASGTVAQARLAHNVQRFVFTVATAARPTGSTYVEWVGPVQPNNAIDGDTWVNTA